MASVAQSQKTSEGFEPAITEPEDALAALTAEPSLEKDPRDRLRDIGDARLELMEAPATGADDEPAMPRRGIAWRRIAIAAVSSAMVGTAVWFAARPAPDPVPPPRVARFAIPASLSTTGTTGALAISPDGARFAYVSGLGLFVRSREGLDVTLVPGVAGPRAGAPFFSPDGKWIGFTDGQALRKVPITGGPAVTIAEVGPAAMASWTAEGILFADMRGLFRVSAEGGTPEALPTNLGANEQTMFPQLLPDRGAIIFTIIPNRTNVPLGAARTAGARVEALDLATGEHRTLLRGGGRARYVPTGHLIYAAGEKLYAVAFDVDRLEVRGEPVEVVTQVGEFAVSDEGTLVFESGTNPPRNHVLVWVDRRRGTARDSGGEIRLSAPVARRHPHRAQRHGSAGPGYLDVELRAQDARALHSRSDRGSRCSRGAPTAKGWRSAALVPGSSSICSGRPSTAAVSRSGSGKATVFKCPSASRPTPGCCFQPMSRGEAATSTRFRWTAPVASTPF